MLGIMDLTDIAQVFLSGVGRGLVRGFLGSELVGLSPGPTAAVAPSGSVRPGDSVLYRQGRGTFPARVVSVNARTGRVTVERASDGKRVVRPVDKLLRS